MPAPAGLRNGMLIDVADSSSRYVCVGSTARTSVCEKLYAPASRGCVYWNNTADVAWSVSETAKPVRLKSPPSTLNSCKSSSGLKVTAAVALANADPGTAGSNETTCVAAETEKGPAVLEANAVPAF